ncbi:PREDICTED: uncharacterized protein LOC100634618 isoform X1 [Amphimedon queenslandica]|uniref:Uncharacterized protein n=1 Tax=Amphimedon queenslandica TaxID=400682 RepID=A0AAN0IRH0_AMPQE|nr:PREDICTED: uncharacterized protein LOC100634618 isoform X1 [Amphimedon queenslandica]|eukprot:XP_011407166.1 PREDICTED: uncharacterized protein LOC100634618 isoform X1 [Amphimedon queenslandica]
MSFMMFCILFFSGIVVCSVAAPVEETALEYNYNVKNKRSNEESPVSHLEKKLNETQEEITKLDEMMILYFEYVFRTSMYEINLTLYHLSFYLIVYRLTGPRFFSKWKSSSIPYMDHIDEFSAWDGQQMRQYIIATSSHWQSVSIYQNTGEGLRHSQTVMIPWATSTKNIKINDTVYIAVACHGSQGTEKIGARLYNWTFDEDIEGTLTQVQTFNETNEITFGKTAGEFFITLTKLNYYFSQTAPVASKVYKWYPKHHQFNFFQSLETVCGIKPNFFDIKGNLFLSITCGYNSSSSIVNSFIYRLNGSRFEIFQAIPLPNSIEIRDLYHAYVKPSHFLVAASVNGPLVVYRLSDFTGHFEVFQTILTSHVMALDIFSIRGEYFMAISSWDYKPSIAADPHAKVAVYKFSGSTYNLFQVIKTFNIPYSVKVFVDVFSNSSMMGIPQALTIDLYKWKDRSNK